MQYQITLTDDEYAALSAIAADRGQAVETLVHEALAEHYGTSSGNASAEADPLIAYMLKVGHIQQAPTSKIETPDERAERERLAASIAPGRLPSEIALDDRGPR